MESNPTSQDDVLVKYGGLNNEEIMMVYLRFKKQMKEVNDNLDQNMIKSSVETPAGTAMILKKVPPEHIAKFRETKYYKTAQSVITKLEPIIELLKECDDYYKKLEDEFR